MKTVLKMVNILLHIENKGYQNWGIKTNKKATIYYENTVAYINFKKCPYGSCMLSSCIPSS